MSWSGLALIRVSVAALATGSALYLTVWSPLECNVGLPRVERRTHLALENQSDWQAAATARKNLVTLDRFEKRCPLSVNIPMLAAVNLKILGRDEDAIRTLKKALMVDRRPEIYFNLGMLQLETGRNDEAMDNLERAVRFNRFLIEATPVGPVREELNRRLRRG